MIRYDLVRVHREDAMPRLKPKLDGFRSHWDRIYIGVTSNPKKRWTKHARRGWNSMRVLYQAFTPSIAMELEQGLIDYARRCNFLVDIENVSPGGEGLQNGSGFHYLYVLVGNKKQP